MQLKGEGGEGEGGVEVLIHLPLVLSAGVVVVEGKKGRRGGRGGACEVQFQQGRPGEEMRGWG